MARIEKGIFGPVQGKIQSIIGSTWKGIPYIKEKTRKTPKPPTEKQINARKRLGFISSYLSPFHPFVTVGFAHVAEKRTEISAALSYNHKAVVGVYPDFEVDYSRFKISTGGLTMVTDIEIELVGIDVIHIKWNKNTSRDTTYNDQLMVAFYSPELHEAAGFCGGGNRAAGHFNYQIDESYRGMIVCVYVGITSFDRKLVSDSIYWGMLQL